MSNPTIKYDAEHYRSVIKKWYYKIGFNKKYDAEFEKELKKVTVITDTDPMAYDINCDDGIKNLMCFLYMCENLSETYKKLGISDKVLLDTLSNMKAWLEVWSKVKGRLYLGETCWLRHGMVAKNFTLGRLQFRFEGSLHDIPKYNIKKGDQIIGVHIPFGMGPLKTEDCIRSFDIAREFFQKHFPAYSYDCFVCDSWLLDDTLKEILPENSNIIKFGNLFEKISEVESDDIIKFVFGPDKTRKDLVNITPKNRLEKAVVEYISSGKNFHDTLGVIKK